MVPRSAIDDLLPRMLEACALAASIVDALRERKVSGSKASLALMFAAARVCRLRGIGREHFTNVSGLMWDLAADDDEARSPPPKAPPAC
jgi:hypothetical protein